MKKIHSLVLILIYCSFATICGPSLLIKIPTRMRPTAFFAMLEKYYHHLSGEVPYHFLITCDCDDTTMNNQEVIDRLQSYPHLTVRFGHNTTKIEAYNDGVADFMHEYDVLLVTSDDMEPVVHGYDKIILQTMLNYFSDFDGVLNYHDGHIGGQCNTYPIIGKKYFNRFGYIYHPDYASLFCDEEFTIVSNMLGKTVSFDQVLLKHRHPALGTGKTDQLYIKNDSYDGVDRSIFIQRLSKNFDIDPTICFLKKKCILTPQTGKTDRPAFINIFIDNIFVGATQTNKNNQWNFNLPKTVGKGQHTFAVIARYKENNRMLSWDNSPNIAFDKVEFYID